MIYKNKKDMISHAIKHSFIFIFSGSIYYLMEMIFKSSHTSHISMFVLAGLCGMVFIDGLNNLFTYDMDFLLQIFICATAITIGELFVGLLFNSDYSIWNYTNMPFNYKGQICLPFYLLWLALSAIFIPVLDWIEWKIFKYKEDTPPCYKIFGKLFLIFDKEGKLHFCF